MVRKRLTDRYRSDLLSYGVSRRQDAILAFAAHLCGGGSVFHVLTHVPEQDGDIYALLVDGSYVVGFEIAYSTDPYVLTEVTVRDVAEVRRRLRQGTFRSRFDRA